jgi:hypothetical protein
MAKSKSVRRWPSGQFAPRKEVDKQQSLLGWEPKPKTDVEKALSEVKIATAMSNIRRFGIGNLPVMSVSDSQVNDYVMRNLNTDTDTVARVLQMDKKKLMDTLSASIAKQDDRQYQIINSFKERIKQAAELKTELKAEDEVDYEALLSNLSK